MAIDESWKEVVVRLDHYSRPGETLIETLERIVKDRELGIYDLARVQNATDEARGLRIMFAAAIMSSEKKELRISPLAQHDLAGPGARQNIVITEHHDPISGDVIYKCFDRSRQRADETDRTR